MYNCSKALSCVSDFSKSDEGVKTATSPLRRLQQKVESLESENRDLQMDVDEGVAELAAKCRELSGYKRDLSRLKQENEMLQDALQNKEEKIKRLQTIREDLMMKVRCSERTL